MRSIKFFLYAFLLNLFVFAGIFLFYYHSRHYPAKPIISKVVNQLQSNAVIRHSVDSAFKGKVVVNKIFSTQDGLTGLVLSRKDNPTEHFIAYEDLSNNTFLFGQIINHDGVNLTLADSVKYIQNTQKLSIYKSATHWPSIITGSKNPLYIIYIAVDPNSTMFAEQYKNLLLDEKDNRLAVHWVLVNYLRPMGPNLAAWVLSDVHPKRRLAQIAASPSSYFDIKDTTTSHGVIEQLRHNWLFVTQNQLAPGPSSIFKVKGHVYVIQGLLDTESLDALFFSNHKN